MHLNLKFFFNLNNPLEQSLRGVFVLNKTNVKSFPGNKFIMFHKIALKERYCLKPSATAFILLYTTVATSGAGVRDRVYWGNVVFIILLTVPT